MRLYLSRAEHVVLVVLVLAILGALAVLGWNGVRSGRFSGVKDGPLYTPQTAQAPSPADPPIMVHVVGAVAHPGVYTLKTGARVEDALTAAGGATEGGYPDALNRAAHIEDGDQISVPTKDEWQKAQVATPATPTVAASEVKTGVKSTATSAAAPLASPYVTHAKTETASTPAPAAISSGTKASSSGSGSGKKELPTGKVNINTATLEELQQLPGVGPTTAQRIVDYRTVHGQFTDTGQLLDVPKIGAKTLEKLQPYICL